MGSYDGIEEVSAPVNRLPFIRPGRYTLEVTAIKEQKSVKSSKKWFIVEYLVKAAAGTGANEVGTECVHMIQLGLETSLGNVKGFVAALLDEPSTSVKGKEVQALVDSQGKDAIGTLVTASAQNIKTKSGADFTKVQYSPSHSAPVSSAA